MNKKFLQAIGKKESLELAREGLKSQENQRHESALKKIDADYEKAIILQVCVDEETPDEIQILAKRLIDTAVKEDQK